ncbi:SpoIIE family protein phosphatase [Streptomyces sp. NPDC096311]|uniref:SpoIIE family protein phosphatase n=1 Tax=Streptomyces sp. NPDC096311 TaxID=3366083 RepID=UPI003803E78A
MTNTADITLSDQLNTNAPSESPIAMLDEEGTVIAWTQAAQRVVGYSAGDMVGRSAEAVLPFLEEAPTISAFVEQDRGRNDCSGTKALRHRSGRIFDTGVRVSALRGQDGSRRWLLSMRAAPGPGTVADGEEQGAHLARVPVGIVVRDLQLRCTWTNVTMESLDGTSPERRFGRRLTDARSDAKTEALEAAMRQVLASGTTKVHEYQAWPTTGPSRGHTMRASCFRLQDADGQAMGVCTISVDVTESRRARDRLAVLSQAGTRLGRSLDVMQTGQDLADLAVPLFADIVAVDLEQSVALGEGPPVRFGVTGERLPSLRRAGLSSIRQGETECPWLRGEPIRLSPASPLTDIVGTGRSHLEPIVDIAPGTWIDQDPALARKIRSTGTHSLMIVPIRARRTLLGTVVFARTQDPAPFQEVDLLLAEELVGRAAQSLDNARQYAREQTTALALQRNLLPHSLRGGVAVEAASRYLPADIDLGVGGDWFDVIPLSGARVALVVGDVVGHGLNAAATMGRLRTAVHTLADMELPPDELLTRLDDTVQRLAEVDGEAPEEAPTAVGATCLYAVYDPGTRKCTMAGAGHPPPAIVDPQGRVTFPALPTGTPLGIGAGVPFEAVEMELAEGSLLALYTDGLVETRDHDIDEGMRRLGTALSQPGRSLEDLCTSAMDNSPNQAPCDDATLLLVRTRSLSPDHVASWTLAKDRTTVPLARHLAASQLSEWGLESLQDSTQLIVSELVTNAVRHSSGPVCLRLIRHQALSCEVSDSEACFPRPRSPRATDENGRGLILVSQLSRRWGSRSMPGGKTVWAEVDLATASSPGQAAVGQPVQEKPDHPSSSPPSNSHGSTPPSSAGPSAWLAAV